MHLGVGWDGVGWEARIRLDYSQSLFFFVSQESHSRTGWTRKGWDWMEWNGMKVHRAVSDCPTQLTHFSWIYIDIRRCLQMKMKNRAGISGEKKQEHDGSGTI